MAEKELSLGEYLRQEREYRCITIEQVASATKVGVKTLHALEEGHYADLPAKPFIRGFVTSYCRFIGLDAKEVLSRFEDYINLKSNERPNREAGHSGYVFEKKDGEQQGRMILLIAIVSFVFVGGLAMIFLKPTLRHRRSSHIDKLREAHLSPESTPISKPSEMALGKDLPAVDPYPTPSASSTLEFQSSENRMSLVPQPQPSISTALVGKTFPEGVVATPSLNVEEGTPDDPLDSGHSLSADAVRHKVVFKVLEDIWVQYQVDGRPQRRFVVRKGRSLVLKAEEGVRFQVSNPKSILVNYNGRGFDKLGSNKKFIRLQDKNSLYFPAEIAEKGDSAWETRKDLPRTPDPVEGDENTQNAGTPISTPSPTE